MNVDSTSFNGLLPTILKHISNSHFIAFDLELSGIPTQQRRDFVAKKQDIQQRYQELKIAAQKFHILQVGLTCVEEDLHNNKYLARPYNFNISPLIGYEIDLERVFTYSTGAVEFLLNHGYRMDAPFQLGVPYLTRSETEDAKTRARLNWGRKNTIPDVIIEPSDEQALSFLQSVRNDIDAWLTSPNPKKAQCLVGGTPSPTSRKPNALLPPSRFQRRLVHQLVRGEYPKLTTSGKGDYIQVSLKDLLEEAMHKEAFERRLANSLFNQSGFRWITQALIGGDLSGISPPLCGPRIGGEPEATDSKQFALRLEELANTVQTRKKVLVGHNCFLDLVYFYQTFIEDLPETVEEFQAAIHRTFDLVIDTKYMATAAPGGEAFRRSQLWQVDDALSKMKTPTLETPTDHPSYDKSEQFHEAGFDSFVTAKVFLRLASQFEADGSPMKNLDAPSAKESPSKTTTSPMKPASEHSNNVEPLSSGLGVVQAVGTETVEPISKPLPTTQSSPRKKFSTTNVFDKLIEVSDELSDDDRIPMSAETPASSSTAVAPAAGEDFMVFTPTTPVSQPHNKPIPSWDAELWSVYGDKLRVYGTIEEVCDLSSKSGERPQEEAEPTAPPAENSTVRRSSYLGGIFEKFTGFVI